MLKTPFGDYQYCRNRAFLSQAVQITVVLFLKALHCRIVLLALNCSLAITFMFVLLLVKAVKVSPNKTFRRWQGLPTDPQHLGDRCNPIRLDKVDLQNNFQVLRNQTKIQNIQKKIQKKKFGSLKPGRKVPPYPKFKTTLYASTKTYILMLFILKYFT